MVKLCYKTLRSKIAEQNWTQLALAEELDISDRQIRNLCKKDTDVKTSDTDYYVCPRCNTTMEREFMHYYDRCGQCLCWKDYKKAVVIKERYYI